MWILISSFHILASLLLIALVLLQQGKGADAGASFGGDSSSAFGPMVENPLKNMTTIVAMVFMVTSVSLAYKARDSAESEGQLFLRTTSADTKTSLEKSDLEAKSEQTTPKPADPNSNSASDASVVNVEK